MDKASGESSNSDINESSANKFKDNGLVKDKTRDTPYVSLPNLTDDY